VAMNKVERELKVANAEGAVERSREQLLETARELGHLLAPRKLARDAWENAKVKGADLAEDAVDAVKKRPVAATGLIAAVTMFLAREPIKDGIVKLYDAMTSDEEEPKKPPQRRPASKPPARRRKTVEKKA